MKKLINFAFIILCLFELTRIYQSISFLTELDVSRKVERTRISIPNSQYKAVNWKICDKNEQNCYNGNLGSPNFMEGVAFLDSDVAVRFSTSPWFSASLIISNGQGEQIRGRFPSQKMMANYNYFLAPGQYKIAFKRYYLAQPISFTVAFDVKDELESNPASIVDLFGEQSGSLIILFSFITSLFGFLIYLNTKEKKYLFFTIQILINCFYLSYIFFAGGLDWVGREENYPLGLAYLNVHFISIFFTLRPIFANLVLSHLGQVKMPIRLINGLWVAAELIFLLRFFINIPPINTFLGLLAVSITFICVLRWMIKDYSNMGIISLPIITSIIAITTLNIAFIKIIAVSANFDIESMLLNQMALLFLVAIRFSDTFKENLQKNIEIKDSLSEQTKLAIDLKKLSSELDEQVRIKTADVKTILASDTKTALAIINRDFSISERSKYFSSNFVDFNSILSCFSKDKANQIMAVFNATFGEAELAFELNSGNLPSTMQICSEEHHVEWRPIISSLGIIERIIFSGHNVEDMIRAQKDVFAAASEAVIIKHIVNIGPKRIVNFIENSEYFLNEAKKRKPVNQDSRRQIFISLHTIKGAARTLGFATLADFVHQAENELDTPFPNFLVANIEQACIELKKIEAHAESIGFNSSKIYLKREEVFEAILSNNEKALLKSKVTTPLEAFILSYQADLAKVAKDLGKESPTLLVDCPEIYLKFDAEKRLDQALIHILRNAVDHSLEISAERGTKPIKGCIHVKITLTVDFLLFAISDDGKGLALSKIRDKAIEHKIINHDAALNSDEIAELIFVPGFSTANSISQISGRGVGMDAVREAIEALGGEVRAKTHSEGEFVAWSLEISLPMNNFS